MLPARAAVGNAKANNANKITRLIECSSEIPYHLFVGEYNRLSALQPFPIVVLPQNTSIIEHLSYQSRSPLALLKTKDLWHAPALFTVARMQRPAHLFRPLTASSMPANYRVFLGLLTMAP